MRFDQGTFAQFEQMLLSPDSPDLLGVYRMGKKGDCVVRVGRGSVITYPGDPKRRKSILLPLLTRWAQHRCLSVDPDPYIGPARREEETVERLLRFRARERKMA